jgi:hypothetical protein
MKLHDITGVDDELWEMANTSPQMSGIPYPIFVSPDYHGRHAPRVKVSNVKGRVVPTDMFYIRLHDLEHEGECRLNAKELERIKWWLKHNMDVLMSYWNNEIDTAVCVNSLKPITEDADI